MQTLPPPLDLDYFLRAMFRRVVFLTAATLIAALIASAFGFAS